MSIYKPSPISITPELVLVSWKVFEVSSDYWESISRHFVGYNITERSGRVSSEIKKFNKRTRIGTTRSGRSYLLQGPDGIDLDAMYVCMGTMV